MSAPLADALGSLANAEYCYLTTTGRVSGRPHEIEIWFGLVEGTVYLISGGGERSDWVKNLQRNSQVTVRIERLSFSGTAQALPEAGAEHPARRALARKYQGWREGAPLSEWARAALLVAIRLDKTL